MIKVRNLFKGFENKKVLQGVDLDIFDGEAITVIGGSGTGKSVLLKCIIGLLRPDSGTVEVDDENICKLDEHALLNVQKKFGYLFQGGALFDSMTVGENVSFGLRQREKHTEKEIAEIVAEKLEDVGLSGIEKLKPQELSGGMKKRVALARAIAHNPKYIMYDEPTTGLDPIMADVINNLIVDLKKKLKVTSIIVTHDMASAYKISDRIGMLYDRKIIYVDSVANIKKTENPYVKQFISGRSEGPINVAAPNGR